MNSGPLIASASMKVENQKSFPFSTKIYYHAEEDAITTICPSDHQQITTPTFENLEQLLPHIQEANKKKGEEVTERILH